MPSCANTQTTKPVDKPATKSAKTTPNSYTPYLIDGAHYITVDTLMARKSGTGAGKKSNGANGGLNHNIDDATILATAGSNITTDEMNATINSIQPLMYWTDQEAQAAGAAPST